VLLTADTATVTDDRKFLTFMRSYPNLIPLSANQVRGIGDALEPFAYDRIYGHYFDRIIPVGAKEAMRASVERYAAAVGGFYEEGR
jgi:hypothetical protein